ncbi:hypothetical protein ALC60_01917 [Trachymyrmex zeteki]|uniref:Uncharacterized protein n=1 Tax=Mycetomoellerius zeteki TaxID=64791 RepID=A0A151XFB5_9HYME|nr:hypothetical protein ALC60_01917 [Trachymyrmex zeteki]
MFERRVYAVIRLDGCSSGGSDGGGDGVGGDGGGSLRGAARETLLSCVKLGDRVGRTLIVPPPREDDEEAKIRETRGKRASLNGDRRGENKGGYSFKLWWPSYEWNRSCKTETARCQAASLERACWNAQERARTLWGLQQSFAAAANRNLFLHPSSKSWLAETIIGADETRSPITTYFHSYPFVPGGAVPLPPPLLNGINNPAAAAITPGLVGHLFGNVNSNGRDGKFTSGKRNAHSMEISLEIYFLAQIANFRNSNETCPMTVFNAGKCTPSIPVIYPPGIVTRVPIRGKCSSTAKTRSLLGELLKNAFISFPRSSEEAWETWEKSFRSRSTSPPDCFFCTFLSFFPSAVFPLSPLQVLLVMKSGGQIKALDGMPILKTAENATFRSLRIRYSTNTKLSDNFYQRNLAMTSFKIVRSWIQHR